MSVQHKLRQPYTKDKIREMRINRKLNKPKVKDVPVSSYERRLGDLIAAGHLRFNGTLFDMDIQTELEDQNYRREINTIKWTNVQRKELATAPHVTGFLTSGHPKDQQIRVKGWFNEDGTLRIELVV